MARVEVRRGDAGRDLDLGPVLDASALRQGPRRVRRPVQGFAEIGERFAEAPKEFMPKMDQGQFIVQLAMPIGTRLDVTNNVATKLERILQNFNGVNVMVNVGSAQEEEEINSSS